VIKKEYKDFSSRFHELHASEPIVVQIELTYKCPLRCVHCYSDCYNNPTFRKKERSTKSMKKIIDKLYKAKCLWLCFTGGDPMTRRDFIELYIYARKKGFLVTIFTSLAALNDKILSTLVLHPPFSIEMTLNGATKETYEKISQVKGSFDKVMKNIRRVMDAKLPLKIKTLLSKDNIHEEKKIRRLVNSFGMNFLASTLIFAGLDQDTTPCEHRLSAEEIIKLEGVYDEEECAHAGNTNVNNLFRCPAGTWQYYIDPLGRLHLCSCIRDPNYGVLNGDIMEGVRVLSAFVKNHKFQTESKCKDCVYWQACHWCTGKAFLETGKWEEPIPYFCELAQKQTQHEPVQPTRSTIGRPRRLDKGNG